MKWYPPQSIHLDHLPHTLTHAVFGPLFNQNVDKLPPSLTHLWLGRDFQQDLHLDTLVSLTHLVILGKVFKPSLPSSLTHFHLGHHASVEPSSYPPSLTHLSIYIYYYSFINLPSSITHLAITGHIRDRNYYDPIPSHLHTLFIPFGEPYEQPLKKMSGKTEIVATPKHFFWDPKPLVVMV